MSQRAVAQDIVPTLVKIVLRVLTGAQIGQQQLALPCAQEMPDVIVVVVFVIVSALCGEAVAVLVFPYHPLGAGQQGAGAGDILFYGIVATVLYQPSNRPFIGEPPVAGIVLKCSRGCIIRCPRVRKAVYKVCRQSGQKVFVAVRIGKTQRYAVSKIALCLKGGKLLADWPCHQVDSAVCLLI